MFSLTSIRLALARKRKSKFSDSLNTVDIQWSPNSQCYKILKNMKGKKILLIFFVSVYHGPGTVKESLKERDWEKEVCSVN